MIYKRFVFEVKYDDNVEDFVATTNQTLFHAYKLLLEHYREKNVRSIKLESEVKYED